MGALTAAIPALAVADPVRPFFSAPTGSGRVLASFERSCYVETATGQLVAILSEPLGRGPFALTARGTPPLAHLEPGDRVVVRAGRLHLGGLRIELSTAAGWNPTLPLLQGPAEAGMGVLAAQLEARAPAEGLARALFGGTAPPVVRARDALDRLQRALAAGERSHAAAAAAALAGLGPGLTPSGDDVLAGILLAVWLWPAAAGRLGARVVSPLLVEAATPRTGRISRAYLEAAAVGQAGDPWHALVLVLPDGGTAVAAAVERILQTGETSGADMLSGFLTGWRMRANTASA